MIWHGRKILKKTGLLVFSMFNLEHDFHTSAWVWIEVLNKIITTSTYTRIKNECWHKSLYLKQNYILTIKILINSWIWKHDYVASFWTWPSYKHLIWKQAESTIYSMLGHRYVHFLNIWCILLLYQIKLLNEQTFMVPITGTSSALHLLRDKIWMIYDQREWGLYNQKSDI